MRSAAVASRSLLPLLLCVVALQQLPLLRAADASVGRQLRLLDRRASRQLEVRAAYTRYVLCVRSQYFSRVRVCVRVR